MRLRLNNKGFSLAEVMVTSMISVFVITSLMYTSLTTQQSIRAGMIFFQAGEVARTKIEGIKALAYAAVVSGTTNNVLLNDNGTVVATDDIFGTVTTTVTDNGDQTKTVAVSVTWTSRALKTNVNHQIGMTTMVANL
jgi:hypothetical protein